MRWKETPGKNESEVNKANENIEAREVEVEWKNSILVIMSNAGDTD